MSAAALQPEPHRSSLAARVLHTPLTELLCGHVAPAFDALQMVAAAGLPPTLTELTCGVIRRTRLWRREKLEVARELLAHFQDGLAAGATADDLAASFGDPAQAAKLIRRAKRRNRPVLWKALRLTRRTIGALVLFMLIVYAVQAIRIFTQRPNIARNFAAEWNAAPLAVPESQRAWPVYREAALALGKWPVSRANMTLRPGGADWPALVKFVDENARSVELFRQAAAMPKLAWVLNTQLQDEDARLINRGYTSPPASAPAQPAVQVPAFVMFLMPPLPVLRDGTRLLTIDAYRAAETNDPGRADADILAILQMADHARETRVLIGDLVAAALSSRTCDLLGTLLHDHPQLFSPEQLVAIAHRLAAVGNGSLRVRFDSERAMFEDILQRFYTDDGHGDGLPRPELLCIASVVDGQSRDNSPFGGAFAKLLFPAASTVMAGRRDLYAAFRDCIDRSEAVADLPLWECPPQDTGDETVIAMRASPLTRLHYWPLSILMPAFGNAGRIAEYATQTRDATLTALALELYHRQHGDYPSSLDALTPQWLPKVPPARYDGRPIKYRLVDGQPLLYSVGVDRKDDGGRLPDVSSLGPDAPNRAAQANRLARDWQPPPDPSRPPAKPLPDGDWILWPPVE